MKPLFWLLAGLFLLFVTATDIRRGYTIDHAWRFDRNDTPLLFWFQITITTALALMALAIGICGLCGISL